MIYYRPKIPFSDYRNICPYCGSKDMGNVYGNEVLVECNNCYFIFEIEYKNVLLEHQEC